MPTYKGGRRLHRLLSTLADQTVEHETIVVDNGSGEQTRELVERGFPGVRVLALDRNRGFGYPVNLASKQAEGDVLVLLNDDCTCEPGFIAALSGAIDPAARLVMAAGVLVEPDDSGTIDSAGMELDRTLLPFDYLNGEPLSVLDSGVPPPIGPSAAAAAFDRQTFLDVGGFDEALFAYWEDVDLVLRLLSEGASCALAHDARGTHEHSATLGSGSAQKNYLLGFGRGYLARKWSAVPRQAPGILVRDFPICVGQALFDRNLAGVRGRIDGFRAARRAPRKPYPNRVPIGGPSLRTTLLRRFRRRARLRARRPPARHV